MTPYELYHEYLALKTHFNADFNYFKYKKTSATENSFDARKDIAFFYLLAKRRNPREFLLSNLVKDTQFSPADFNLKRAEETYYDWCKRVKSITYMFRKEIDLLDSNFDKNFEVINGQSPKLLKLYYNEDVSIETISILLDLTKSLDYWDKNIIDPIWPFISKKIRKYIPFIKYDKDNIKEIVKERFKKDE